VRDTGERSVTDLCGGDADGVGIGVGQRSGQHWTTRDGFGFWERI
jgi:hypothetical protein